MFKIIACINQNSVIGNNNKLLYHFKEDMKFFKEMTWNQVVIMGRKTFESLPNKKPLPNRINIIISRREDFSVEGDYDNVFIVKSLREAENACESMFKDLQWYVIGGGEIYREALKEDMVDEMYLTVVHDNAKGDTTFPNISELDRMWHYEDTVKRFDWESGLKYDREHIVFEFEED